MHVHLLVALLVAVFASCCVSGLGIAKDVEMPVGNVDLNSSDLVPKAPTPRPGALPDESATAEKSDSFISELVIGGGWHDVGAFGRNKETGADVNFEIRFSAPSGTFWSFLLSPRPHLGVHLNTAGHTDQLFSGLTWLFDLGSTAFAGGSVGLTVHNGESNTNAPNKKQFGLPVLLRQSIEFGVHITRHHAVSLMADHISNGGLNEDNEGMETLSLRYAYRL